jgi:hypothetical protein
MAVVLTLHMLATSTDSLFVVALTVVIVSRHGRPSVAFLSHRFTRWGLSAIAKSGAGDGCEAGSAGIAWA